MPASFVLIEAVDDFLDLRCKGEKGRDSLLLAMSHISTITTTSITPVVKLITGPTTLKQKKKLIHEILEDLGKCISVCIVVRDKFSIHMGCFHVLYSITELL